MGDDVNLISSLLVLRIIFSGVSSALMNSRGTGAIISFILDEILIDLQKYKKVVANNQLFTFLGISNVPGNSYTRSLTQAAHS